MSSGDQEAERDSPSAASDQATVSETSGVRTQSTVQCAFPGEAAATVRVGGEGASKPPPLLPQRFDDLGEIARGGMATVRKVYDHLIMRETAMKVLRGPEDMGSMTRFLEEAQITGQLEHPNIVPIYDVEMDERGLPTRFTMKLVQGRTLQSILDRHTPQTLTGRALEELLQIFLKVCDAVSFAHSHGVIHRDLKPSNLMVGSHGQVYVMDWGIAHLKQGQRASDAPGAPAAVRTSDSDSQDQPGTLSGTPSYMAPEQAWGRIAEIDERTDVFGLGAILYHVLTLEAPYTGRGVQDEIELAREAAIEPPEQRAGERGLPPGLCRIAMRALSKRPQDRYGSVDALKADIAAFLRGGGWFGTREFHKGEVIVREGDAADAAYILTHGTCELHKNMQGERHFIRLLGPGEVFGETAIFGSTTRTATVIAASDVTVVVVTRDALERELDRSVWLRAFVEAVAERFLAADRKLTELGVHTDGRPGPSAK